jgi:uncharacterized protein YwqG/predicted nucleic acid-binding protein
MPIFLDACALAKRYLHEGESTLRMRRITSRFEGWGGFVVSSLIEPEVISALGKYARAKASHAAHYYRLHPRVVDTFRRDLSHPAFTIVPVTDDEVEAAADLLRAHPEYRIGAAEDRDAPRFRDGGQRTGGSSAGERADRLQSALPAPGGPGSDHRAGRVISRLARYRSREPGNDAPRPYTIANHRRPAVNLDFVLLLALVLSLSLLIREIAGLRRDRRQRSERSEFPAENPEGPPFTEQELDAFKAWHATLALPAVELVPAPGLPVAAGGTRIGGPVWLPDGEAWPADARGVPLEFVAQVDFAELPPLPDFPATGLLQFFVGRDDVFGADFDEPARGTARVLWRPDALAGGRLHPHPTSGDDDLSPYERESARDAGVPLTGRTATHLPGRANWRIDQHLEGQLRRPGIDRIDDLLYAEGNETALVHHVGGHPVYTQDDFRRPGRYDDYDRTLLRLTSEGNLIWGDCGEAVFLVRRDDLLRRDFSSVVFWWDCT